MKINEMMAIYRERYQKIVHPTLLCVLVVIWFVRAFGISSAISQDVNYGIVLGVIAFMLWDIAQNTYTLQRTRFFTEQDDLYVHLQQIITSKPPSDVILIQYSGSKCDSLITSLLKQGANVTLYLQHPGAAVSKFQKNRIENSLASLNNEINFIRKPCKLTIKTYSSPASLRAVLIDRSILAAGWYTYFSDAQSSAVKHLNDFVIHGHNAPGLICFGGSAEFAALIQEFDKLTANFDQAFDAAHGAADVVNYVQEQQA